MPKYRIMTFDGGGIRGALTAMLLKRLNARFPTLFNSVDLFAGTSTGSFIALGLAYGKTPGEIAELYSEQNGRYILSMSLFPAAQRQPTSPPTGTTSMGA